MSDPVQGNDYVSATWGAGGQKRDPNEETVAENSAVSPASKLVTSRPKVLSRLVNISLKPEQSI